MKINNITETKPKLLYSYATLILGVTSTLNLGIITMFFKIKALNYFEVSILFSIILITSLILEYPSGILADKFGRKKIYCIGMFFTGLKYIIYSLFNCYYLLVIASFLAGAGGALISGSLRAWLIVEENKNRKKDLKEYFSALNIAKNVLSILVVILVIFIRGQFNILFLAMGIILILSSLSLYTYLDDNYGDSMSISEYNQAIIRTFFTQKIYWSLTIIFTIQVSIYSIFILYWPARLIELDVNKSFTTLFYCVFLIGGIMINFFMPKILARTSRIFYIGICVGIMIFAFATFGINHFFGILLSMFIFGLGYNSINPVFFGWLGTCIDEKYSAGLISMITAVGSLLSIVLNIFVGVLMDNFTLDFIQMLAVMLGIISIIVIWFISITMRKID